MSEAMRLASDPTRSEDLAVEEAFPLPSTGALVDNRYLIVRSLGAGGMGAVFEAEIVSVGRPCAIKFMRRELAARSRSAARFEREAQLLGRLQHEHLTAVLDYGLYQGEAPFLVMEYLEGRTLKRLLEEEGRLPLARALAILLQLARGMGYVHAQNIVHRDLKPENLMLLERSDGRDWLKILDFGIARGLDDSGEPITRSGAELGTAHYMSPEQARGTKELTASSDIYAIGAIAYELLTGQRVHAGDSYNAVIFQLLTQPHRPLRQIFPECPSELACLIERCLEKEPGRRPSDAAALARELSALKISELGAPPTIQAKSELGRAQRWLVGAAGLALAGVAAIGVQRMRRAGVQPATSTPQALVACPPASGGAFAADPPRLAAAEPAPAEAVVVEQESTTQKPTTLAPQREPARHAPAPTGVHTQHESSGTNINSPAAGASASTSEAFPFVTANPYGEP